MCNRVWENELVSEENPQRNLLFNVKDVNRLHVLVCSLWRLAEQPPAVLQSITCAINAVARMGWNATVPWGSSHGGIFFNEAKWTASFSSGVEGCMCTGQHHAWWWKWRHFCNCEGRSLSATSLYRGCLLCFTDCHCSIPPSRTHQCTCTTGATINILNILNLEHACCLSFCSFSPRNKLEKREELFC